MARLNQIIAIEKGVKSKAHSAVSELNKLVQKDELFNGFQRVYQKKDDDGEDLPSESRRVQLTYSTVLSQAITLWSETVDITARKDYTNTKAVAPVVIDGQTIVENAPVSYLLFLEKVITDFRTLANNIPVLDSSDEWELDQTTALYKTKTVITGKSKKIPRVIVKYDATAEHPAQTELVGDDVTIGHWHTTKQSGAIPKTKKVEILTRIDTLLNAVKSAREIANSIDETPTGNIAESIFAYIAG